MKITKAEFVASSGRVADKPRPALHEFAFIGRSNVISGSLAVENGKTYVITKSGYRAELKNVLEEFRKDQEVVLSVRPEEFLLDRTSTEGIDAVVDDCVFLGLNTHYFVHLNDGTKVEIIQESQIDSMIKKGTKVKLEIKTGKVNIFNEDGSYNLVEGVTNDLDVYKKGK